MHLNDGGDMKKRLLRGLILCALCLLFVSVPAFAAEETDDEQVRAFVERLYTKVLGREAEGAGLDAWTEVLVSKKEEGAKVAQNFFNSAEFLEKNLDDETYVTLLYRTFFDRDPDSVGFEAWMDVLDSGLSRNHVLKGFAESVEFTEVCDSYGIVRGAVELTEPRDQNEQVTLFLCRCYRVFLGREADAGGLNNWAKALLSGEINAKDAAEGFVFSPEFQSKNLDDENYVKTLYRGLFDRDADSEGKSAWVEKLSLGVPRVHVFYGFADSLEFRELAASFSLKNNWKTSVFGLVYENEYFTLELPKSWEGEYYVTEFQSIWHPELRCMAMGNKDNRHAFGEEYNAGNLFCIQLFRSKEDIENLPSYEIITYKDGIYYVATYPTDAQYDFTNTELSNSYMKMRREVPQVIRTFNLK